MLFLVAIAVIAALFAIPPVLALPAAHQSHRVDFIVVVVLLVASFALRIGLLAYLLAAVILPKAALFVEVSSPAFTPSSWAASVCRRG